MEAAFIGIGGIFLGIIITYLYLNGRHRGQLSMLQTQRDELRSMLTLKDLEIQTLEQEKNGFLSDLGRLSGQFEITSSQLSDSRREVESERRDLRQAREELITAKSELDALGDKLDFQKQELERTASMLQTEFRLMADKMLEEKSRRFTEINEEKLRSVLDPLRNNLTEFRQKVEDTYDRESKQRFALEKELGRLMELNQQLGKEASNLTSALKQNNKVLGNWGEMILESLLENSGLARGREYFVQEFLHDQSGSPVRDEQGQKLQPDVTVLYPDGRRLVIDSKVSLQAFEQFNACEDRAAAESFLKDHCHSLRSHIDNLSKKEYPRYAGTAFDLVMLFIPLEPAYFLALRQDPSLWKYAFDRKVLLTTSTQLLAILRIVGEFWKVDLQNRNALEIAEKAGALYDKFAGFVESMDLLGQSLEKAGQQFETARKRLSEGPGNLLRRSDELKRMGAKTSKRIPWTDDRQNP